MDQPTASPRRCKQRQGFKQCQEWWWCICSCSMQLPLRERNGSIMACVTLTCLFRSWVLLEAQCVQPGLVRAEQIPVVRTALLHTHDALPTRLSLALFHACKHFVFVCGVCCFLFVGLCSSPYIVGAGQDQPQRQQTIKKWA